MIVVDTSVWIDHLRRSDEQLVRLLQAAKVLVHPFVVGELALGNLRNRDIVVRALLDLPSAPVAADEVVLAMIADMQLFGRGIGYVDAHLLAEARTAGVKLWTRDKRLWAVAQETGTAAGPAAGW